MSQCLQNVMKQKLYVWLNNCIYKYLNSVIGMHLKTLQTFYNATFYFIDIFVCKFFSVNSLSILAVSSFSKYTYSPPFIFICTFFFVLILRHNFITFWDLYLVFPFESRIRSLTNILITFAVGKWLDNSPDELTELIRHCLKWCQYF